MSLNFNPQNLAQTIQQVLNNAKQLIKQAETGKTWEAVFNPLDDIELELNKMHSINSHLNSVCFNKKFNQEYEKTLSLISNFYNNLGTNHKLYIAFKNLQNTKLNTKQRYILQNVLRDFELSGIDLTGTKQQQFKQLKTELSLLSNEFANNTLQATNSYKQAINKDKLAGLNAHDLEKLATKEGYFLNLQQPAYMAVMTYCDNAKIRQQLYTAYVGRASEFDAFDNTQIMQKILTKRVKLAQLLNFENYAQYSLASKMVTKITKVEDFLNALIDKSKQQAKIELQTLQTFAGKILKPWDLNYYSEKFRTEQYGFSKNEVAKYFPFNQVLNGLINLVENLYQVKINLIKEKTYHPDVIVLEIINVGKIYLDPFARQNKRSGAWMSDYQGLSKNHKPIAFVVCNASAPTQETQSLLEFDEVTTLFHEFGHTLHHLLTEVAYPSVAGINGVPWDGVELPSQYMEFFAYEKLVIKQISKHYQTGKTLPSDLFEKLVASKNFNSAMAMLRQCEFSLWDILTHYKTDDTYQILQQVQQKTALIPTIPENRFLNTFGHIFSGGYAAGYYSYKWAEVLAADAYAVVQKNPSKTNVFRKYILATGGESDFMENYIKFSGRTAKIDALLQANSIK